LNGSPAVKSYFKGQRGHFITPNSKGVPLNKGKTVTVINLMHRADHIQTVKNLSYTVIAHEILENSKIPMQIYRNSHLSNAVEKMRREEIRFYRNRRFLIFDKKLGENVSFRKQINLLSKPCRCLRL
jgi:hypothetical protein